MHVTLSSGISGVINSAMIAKETLEERYPERKIYIVDSLGASSGYGLFMNRLADLRDNGYTLEQLYDWAMQHRLNLHHWFLRILPFTSKVDVFPRQPVPSVVCSASAHF